MNQNRWHFYNLYGPLPSISHLLVVLVFITFLQAVMAMIETILLIYLKNKINEDEEGDEPKALNFGLFAASRCNPKKVEPNQAKDESAEESENVDVDHGRESMMKTEQILKKADSICFIIHVIVSTIVALYCTLLGVLNEALFKAKVK